MSIRCVKCAYRDEGRVGTPGHPGCAYLQITGRSRLRAAYEALGVHELTDAVREAMKPEHCPMYRHGDKRELTETRILLDGSTPERAGDPKRKLDERAALALYKQGKYDKEIARERGPFGIQRPAWCGRRRIAASASPPRNDGGEEGKRRAATVAETP